VASPMKFFYSPGSCALASHITLAEAGADYEAVRVDFAAGQQRSDDFLAVNPKGRVPALVTESGVLTETPAILLYLAQTHLEAQLAPLGDAFALARLQAFNSYLCSTVHVAHAHGGRGYRWADTPEAIAEMKRKVPETVGECFSLIEDEYLKGPWVSGEEFSICDAYLYTVTRWLDNDGVERSEFPKVDAHFAQMEARPAVGRVLEEHFG
jgi:glutathione S-transferase